jgi:flagellar protein FliS
MAIIKTDEYTARITNATPLGLVIITYEIILDYIKEARNDNSLPVEQARKFLSSLRTSLDMQYDLAYNLMSLYEYVDKMLARYYFNANKKEYLDECEKVLKPLLESWKKIEKEQTGENAVMDNVQHIYAGLTYGRNGRLSEYVDTDSSRGFKA